MKLIVEMEMPKGCSCVEKGIEKRCPMAGIDHYLQIRCRVQGGRIVHTSNQSGIVDRPSWCPIVGVLPEQHGDLIDRDELIKDCYPDDEFDAYVIYADDVYKAKAVIAAERKDDEQD